MHSRINPTKVRLSDNFLLSDFLGNHSVYTKGYANELYKDDMEKLAEGVTLCAEVLEPLLAAYGPLTISYGLISLDLARKIVTYQSPEKPSYHQWNDGAAADVLLHKPILAGVSPVSLAFAIDSDYPMSRTITYSESPYLCLGTKEREVEEKNPRKAFYENRFVGVRQPLFVKYSENAATRAKQKAAHSLEHDWEGAGYPTYHGGGVRQLQHIRVGRYAMYSDFMYAAKAVHKGFVNVLRPTDEHIAKVAFVGGIYSDILDELGVNRLSIVKAYEAPRWSDDETHHWIKDFKVQVVPPRGLHASDVADAAKEVMARYDLTSFYGASNPNTVATFGAMWPSYL